MKSIFLAIASLYCLASLGQNDPYANSNSVKKQWDDCQSKLHELRGKMQQRNNKYDNDAKEYRAGQFCSDCGRTKSEIEQQLRVSFGKHIQEGASGGRHIRTATQQEMNNLYQRYLSDFNSLQQQLENAQKNCNSLGNQYNNAKNQDYQNMVKGQQDAARKQQEENNRKQQEKLQQQQEAYNAMVQQQQEQQRQQRLREEMASAEMTAKMTANMQETDAKKDAYSQESALNDGYVDRTSDARQLLDPSRAANESEVFKTYESTTDFESKKGLLSSMVNQYNQFKETIRDKLPSFFGTRMNEYDNFTSGQNEDIPSEGWSFERTRLNVRIIQPVKNLFRQAREAYDASENYEDEYTRAHQLFDDAQPKTDRETREFVRENGGDLTSIVEYELNGFDGTYDENEVNTNIEHSVNRTQAQAIGNVAGKIPVVNAAKKLYDNTVGGLVDKFMNAYKRGRGTYEHYNSNSNTGN